MPKLTWTETKAREMEREADRLEAEAKALRLAAAALRGRPSKRQPKVVA